MSMDKQGPSEQAPRILFQPNAGIIWVVTKYLITDVATGKCKPIVKHDITSQLEKVLDSVYEKANNRAALGITTVKRVHIAYICGDLEMVNSFNGAVKDFAEQNFVVLIPTYHLAGDNMNFVELEKRKVEMADVIFVVTKDKTIYTDTICEEVVEYAKSLNKRVEYLGETWK